MFFKSVAPGRLIMPPVNSPTPMSVWTAHAGLRKLLKKEEKGMKLGEVGRWEVDIGRF